MNWIYLWHGLVEQSSHGIAKVDVYAIGRSEAEAIEKCSKVLSDDYTVRSMDIIGELVEFGVEVFLPEDM